jgi:Bifunctional DNA primase/polymerase, N-terminal
MRDDSSAPPPESGNSHFNPLTVAAIRDRCWDHGWRPMPVLSWDHPDPITAGKAPIGKDWGKRARQNPPECIKLGAVVKHALNTGLLCDGLRVIDGDVDDHEIAGKIRLLATTMFGDTIGRYRDNSARFALAYRAADGSPAKRAITGTAGKVEVLGHGQQFVAHGVHPSGAAIWWSPAGPDETAVDDLPAVTEQQITDFLAACASLIGADPEQAEQRTNGHDHEAGEPQADTLRIAAALGQIPNDGPADWEGWNRVGMAVWAATGGNDMLAYMGYLLDEPWP